MPRASASAMQLGRRIQPLRHHEAGDRGSDASRRSTDPPPGGRQLAQVAELAAAQDLHAAVADVVGVAGEGEARAAARARVDHAWSRPGLARGQAQSAARRRDRPARARVRSRPRGPLAGARAQRRRAPPLHRGAASSGLGLDQPEISILPPIQDAEIAWTCRRRGRSATRRPSWHPPGGRPRRPSWAWPRTLRLPRPAPAPGGSAPPLPATAVAGATVPAQTAVCPDRGAALALAQLADVLLCACRVSFSMTVESDTVNSPLPSSVAARSRCGEWTLTSTICRCLSSVRVTWTSRDSAQHPCRV